jgi:hypothetical protein
MTKERAAKAFDNIKDPHFVEPLAASSYFCNAFPKKSCTMLILPFVIQPLEYLELVLLR